MLVELGEKLTVPHSGAWASFELGCWQGLFASVTWIANFLAMLLDVDGPAFSAMNAGWQVVYLLL